MGKSSSATIGYKYLVAYHHGLCAHTIDKFLEFRAANKVAWSGELTASGTISINAPNLFGGDKDQGGIVSDVDVMFGEATQQPNPYLLSAFGDQVPGWRGFTTLVFKGGEFGAMNPYPQKPAYKILATKAGWDNGCWYPEKCEVPIASSTTLASDADGWEYQVIPYHDNPGYENLDIPASGWIEDGQGPFSSNTGDGPAGNVTWPQDTILWARRSVTVQGGGAQTLTVIVENGCVVFINGALAGAVNRDNVSIPGNQNNTFTFPVQAGQTYDIAVKAFDEHPTEGGTYLSISIAAPGLVGINPAHVLYEARTAPDRGQEPTGSMADASWRAAADWFYSQGFGLCQVEYNADNESVEDFIDRISKLCNCSVSQDPVDGLWYIDIANGVYDLASLPILTDDDILEFEDAPSLPDDVINSVAVEYFDPQQWTTVTTRPASALALISANGLNHQTNVYHEIPTADLANRIALRDLANFITPSNALPITTTRKPYAWRRYTYFRLQAPKRGIADMVCLLVEKSDGTLKSGAIKITAAQDIYGLASAGFSETEPGVDTRPPQIPLGIMQQAAWEAPYIEVVRRLSRADLAALPADVGYLMTSAQDPGTSRDYDIAVSTDSGSTYTDTGTRGPWCPSALIVEGDTLTDAPPATNFTLSGGTLLSGVAVGSAAYWNGEIVRVDALDTGANTITLGRGCADTVPQEQAPNSRIWFYDGFAGEDTTEYTDGEAIDVKLLTNTGTQQLDPSLATPIAITFNQRQVRPYPPAAVQINALWYPGATTTPVTVTFNDRDRVSQADQLVDYSAASVGPEAGVTYTLRGYLGGALDEAIAAQPGSPIVWDPGVGGSARIELVAVRDGIESAVWSHDCTITGAQLWTPANLATAPEVWLNDTSAVTDDGTTHCSQWNDASGNNRHFVQGTAAQRPAITAVGQHGRRVLTFDGVDDWLSGTATCAALTNNIAAQTTFLVANPDPNAGSTVKRLINFSIGQAGNTSFRAGVFTLSGNLSTTQRRLDTDPAKNALTAYAAKAWHLFAADHDWIAQTVSLRLDGADAATTTATAQGSGNTSATNSIEVTLGGTASVSGQCSATAIGELIVLGYIPTSTDRQKIEGYLAYRWGLQANLPADHPYKSSPPTV